MSRARSLPRASSRASSRASHRTASLPRAASRASIISSSRGSGIISGSALAQPRLSPHAPCSSLAHRHRALTRASSHLRLYPVSGSATASWAPLLSLGLCCHPSGSVASRFYHSPTRLSPLRLCCRLPGLSIASLACLLPLGLGYHFSRVATVPRAPARLSSMATSPRALAWLSLFEYGYRFSLFRLLGSALAFRARLSLLSPLRPGYRLLGSATASRAPLSLLRLGSRLLGSTIPLLRQAALNIALAIAVTIAAAVTFIITYWPWAKRLQRSGFASQASYPDGNRTTTAQSIGAGTWHRLPPQARQTSVSAQRLCRPMLCATNRAI